LIGYQSHDATSTSVSNTRRKLSRLKLPDSLAGMRVLDIGCNEGYFCGIANERGAAEVVGIDYVASNIEVARQRYSREGIRFVLQPWKDLPEGSFDLIIWASAMHYELDPRLVVDSIATRLAPGGLFVLECGVIMSHGKEYVPVPRIADTRYYPSRDFLIDCVLAEFSVRQVAEAESADGDLVPRAVFHCRKASPIVVLIRGNSGVGKSSLAERLKGSATKTISLDMVVSRMGQNSYPHDAFERFMVAHYDPADLTRIYLDIDEADLTSQYVDWLAKMVAATDAVVIVEGFMSDKQCLSIKRRLKDKAQVWDLKRVEDKTHTPSTSGL